MSDKVKKTFVFSFLAERITLEFPKDTLVSSIKDEIVKEKKEFENMMFEYIENAVIVNQSKRVDEVGDILYTSVSIPIKLILKTKEIPVLLKPWQTSDDLEQILLRTETFSSDTVIEFEFKGKIIESIPAMELKNAEIHVKTDVAQLVKLRKEGYSDELATKALNLTKWNTREARVILKNKLLEDEALLSEILNSFESLSAALLKLSSFGNSIKESFQEYKKSLENAAKEAEMKVFDGLIDSYARTHDFNQIFKTDSHKKLALEYGFVENQVIEQRWKDNKAKHPFLVSISAALFYNNPDYIVNIDSTPLSGLNVTEIKNQAIKEGILQQKTVYPEYTNKENVQQIMEIGFNMNTAMRALIACKGSIERAVDSIINQELENIERSRGLNPNPTITTANILTNIRVGDALTLLQQSQKDSSKFLEFLKYLKLKNPEFYMYPDLFAACLGIPKPVPVEDIVKYGISNGFITGKKFFELNNSFGRDIEAMDPEKAAELLSVIGDFDPNASVFLLEAYGNDVQKVLAQLDEEAH